MGIWWSIIKFDQIFGYHGAHGVPTFWTNPPGILAAPLGMAFHLPGGSWVVLMDLGRKDMLPLMRRHSACREGLPKAPSGTTGMMIFGPGRLAKKKQKIPQCCPRNFELGLRVVAPIIPTKDLHANKDGTAPGTCSDLKTDPSSSFLGDFCIQSGSVSFFFPLL